MRDSIQPILNKIFTLSVMMPIIMLFSGCATRNLNEAIIKQDHEAAIVFLDNGADVNEKVPDSEMHAGFTPLCLAVNRSVCDFEKRSVAWKEEDPDRYSYEITQGKENCRQHLQLIKRLIKAGANINESCENELRPIFFAIAHDIEAVKILVENGASLKVSKHGEPYVTTAYKNDKFDVARYLVSKGARGNGDPLEERKWRNHHKRKDELLRQEQAETDTHHQIDRSSTVAEPALAIAEVGSNDMFRPEAGERNTKVNSAVSANESTDAGKLNAAKIKSKREQTRQHQIKKAEVQSKNTKRKDARAEVHSTKEVLMPEAQQQPVRVAYFTPNGFLDTTNSSSYEKDCWSRAKILSESKNGSFSCSVDSTLTEQMSRTDQTAGCSRSRNKAARLGSVVQEFGCKCGPVSMGGYRARCTSYVVVNIERKNIKNGLDEK